ncbi:MAG: hypothetical protein ACJAVI_004116 [Candidatus Azotimanducaceae bacterium]|jgi:hypothetical protein
MTSRDAAKLDKDCCWQLLFKRAMDWDDTTEAVEFVKSGPELKFGKGNVLWKG